MLDLSSLPHAAGKPFEYISEVDVDRKKRSAGRELILPPGLHHAARIQFRHTGDDDLVNTQAPQWSKILMDRARTSFEVSGSLN
jgi:hypothetical protein